VSQAQDRELLKGVPKIFNRHRLYGLQMIEPFVRENEIDPKNYYPPDVYSEP